MKPSRERDTYAYIKTILEREFPHVLHPFLTGTITAVVGTGPWTVDVLQFGEGAGAGTWEFVCPIFTKVGSAEAWTPVIGDRVECIRRDAATGYVLWKLPKTT